MWREIVLSGPSNPSRIPQFERNYHLSVTLWQSDPRVSLGVNLYYASNSKFIWSPYLIQQL